MQMAATYENERFGSKGDFSTALGMKRPGTAPSEATTECTSRSPSNSVVSTSSVQSTVQCNTLGLTQDQAKGFGDQLQEHKPRENNASTSHESMSSLNTIGMTANQVAGIRALQQARE
mmetsp:Transcript_15358/g.42106  ORF Transcript_15358/g.42106 Transcript_15358/m.42106 type:complete len:118 (+) Transcript_15358:108-461(+)|eukprot:CAMPEP_0117543722 /NCGR_PEP_ID=MMETSP0784-20121206/45207_1 /TAXON_ID=39447 /ORGANISM="" /LENGTH=117 /DNA_ID=CAMNT_0005340509 /DNA_START=104 /DNA_END=457 /DNA_ORIENTATION=-